MATTSPPDKGMFMGIPVGRGGLDRLLDLFPGLKASPFKRQRAQDFPPGFDQIQVGGVGRLVDKLPARMMDHEQQQVTAMMHLQIVHDGVDALCVFWDLGVHVAEEVDEVHGTAARVALRPALSCGLPQGPIDIAKGPAPIIDLLGGALSRADVHLDRLLARIALGADWPHLINV